MSTVATGLAKKKVKRDIPYHYGVAYHASFCFICVFPCVLVDLYRTLISLNGSEPS